MATPAAVLSLLVKTSGVQSAVGYMRALDAAGRKASNSMDDVAKAQSKGRAAFDKVAKGAGLAAVGVGALGAVAVKSAADYQTSMNQLQAVSGSTGREMSKLSKLAIKLGNDTKLPGTSAQDAATAMTEMIKAGVSLRDTMDGVRSVLVLSAAAGIDNAQAAEIASNALNAFKLRGKDVTMVTDQLANTANASSVEIRDVADSFKMAATVFSGLQSPVLGAKGAMTELNVAIGLLGNAGIKGSDAGTSLKQMLLQLTGPSDRAKEAMKGLYAAAVDNSAAQGHLTTIIQGGNKDRQAALNAIYKTNPALAKQGDIAYDAAGKMRSLKDIIALVTAGTKNMTQEQKNAYITQIFGADATRSVLALMNAGPAAFDKMTAAVTKQGAAQDLANARMKGFNGAVEAMKSSLETLAINVGTKLLPALTLMVKVLNSVTSALSPTAWLVLIGVIGTLGTAIFAVNTAWKVYTATTALATAATQGSTAAMILLNSAIALSVVGALVALGVALVVAYNKSKTFRDIVNGLATAIKTALGNSIRFILGAFSSMLTGVSKVARALGKDGLADKAAAGARAIDDLRDSLKAVPDKKNVDVAVKITLDGQSIDVSKAKPLSQTPPGGDGPGVIGSRIADGVRSSKRVHDGAKKLVADGIGSLIPGIGAGKGAGNLMGASRALAPFAAIGARMGLHVSSGLRPGAITSSGNVSYHASGRAIDMAGSPQDMMRTFRFLKTRYGRNLAELIYTPGGVGIKDGRPFTYTGQVARDHYDHVHVAYTGGGGDGIGDGIGDVARLARAAGFKGQALITAIAVAGAESGFRSHASNRNTNGSIDRGYWQINSVHGSQSTFSPTGNARAAYAISSGGRNWRPWVTYNTGAYRRYLDQARAAAGSVSGNATRTGGGGATSTASAAATAQKVNPLEMQLAQADLAIAQARGHTFAGGRRTSANLAKIQAMIGKRAVISKRIAKIRKALKGHLTPATRLRLTQELTQRLGEHAQLSSDIADLRQPASTGTGGVSGDIGGGGTGDDPNKPLIDAQNAAAEAAQQLADAMKEHQDAVDSLKAEIAAQTAFATSATATQNAQAWKALADIMSGQIGGYGGAAGRSLTAGAGTVVRY